MNILAVDNTQMEESHKLNNFDDYLPTILKLLEESKFTDTKSHMAETNRD